MTHTPATVLRDAAQWLDNDPKRWGRDAFLSPVDKCRCAAGAIAWVLSPLDVEANPVDLRTSDYTIGELGKSTAGFFAEYIADHFDVPLFDEPVETIAWFNDNPSTTVIDVITAMRDCADEWDARKRVAA